VRQLGAVGKREEKRRAVSVHISGVSCVVCRSCSHRAARRALPDSWLLADHPRKANHPRKQCCAGAAGVRAIARMCPRTLA
jgi:hypothetical protein